MEIPYLPPGYPLRSRSHPCGAMELGQSPCRTPGSAPSRRATHAEFATPRVIRLASDGVDDMELSQFVDAWDGISSSNSTGIRTPSAAAQFRFRHLSGVFDRSTLQSGYRPDSTSSHVVSPPLGCSATISPYSIVDFKLPKALGKKSPLQSCAARASDDLSPAPSPASLRLPDTRPSTSPCTAAPDSNDLMQLGYPLAFTSCRTVAGKRGRHDRLSSESSSIESSAYSGIASGRLSTSTGCVSNSPARRHQVSPAGLRQGPLPSRLT